MPTGPAGHASPQAQPSSRAGQGTAHRQGTMQGTGPPCPAHGHSLTMIDHGHRAQPSRSGQQGTGPQQQPSPRAQVQPSPSSPAHGHTGHSPAQPHGTAAQQPSPRTCPALTMGRAQQGRHSRAGKPSPMGTGTGPPCPAQQQPSPRDRDRLGTGHRARDRSRAGTGHGTGWAQPGTGTNGHGQTVKSPANPAIWAGNGQAMGTDPDPCKAIPNAKIKVNDFNGLAGRCNRG